DNRYDGCRLLSRDDGGGSARDDNTDLQPDELGHDFREAFAAPLSPAILDRDRAALDPTEFAQPLHKSCGPFAHGGRRERAQESDGRKPLRLLCAHAQRPKNNNHRGAANERDELAPPHEICPQVEDYTLAYRWARAVLCITAK